SERPSRPGTPASAPRRTQGQRLAEPADPHAVRVHGTAGACHTRRESGSGWPGVMRVAIVPVVVAVVVAGALASAPPDARPSSVNQRPACSRAWRVVSTPQLGRGELSAVDALACDPPAAPQLSSGCRVVAAARRHRVLARSTADGEADVLP